MKSLRNLILLLAFTTVTFSLSAQAVDRSIADPPGRATLISDQFRFTEGPVWIEGQGLLFSDIQANTMYIWNQETGITVFREPSHYANGNALDKHGNLITAQHNRMLTRTDRTGKVKVIAKTYNGRKFNSPNDVVVRSDNSIYFSDPHYGITYAGFGPQQAEQEHSFSQQYKLYRASHAAWL